MANTDFNVESLRIKELPPLDPAVAKPRRRRREFVMITRRQLAALRQGKASGTAWNVFAELVWLDWEGKGKPFKFSRQVMSELGISHDSGGRALRALAELGLISVNQPTARSQPRVTVHPLP